MNKHDYILIFIIITIIIILFLSFKFNENNVNKAYVYYEDNLIKTIDLSKDSKYKVKGYNGDISIIVKNNKIKVDQENSPLHLCSKQGYISKSYESIICLPNKIVIKLESNSDTDAILR